MAEITEYPAKAEEMARLINTERKARGLSELYCSPYLNSVAMLRANEASTYMSHTRPNGEYFTSAIDTDIVDYGAATENIASMYADAQETIQQLKNSSKHWAAIINEDYTHMGIGCVYNPDGESGYSWYWVQLFTNDLRGDVEYDGQYLPEIYTGISTIKVVDDVTGDSSLTYKVNIASYNINGKTIFISDAIFTQNGTAIEATTDSSYTYFYTKKDVITNISKIPYTPDSKVWYPSLKGYPKGCFASASPSNIKVSNNGTVTNGADITFTVKPIKLKIYLQDSKTYSFISGAIWKLTGTENLSGITSTSPFTLSADGLSVTITSGPYETTITKIPVYNYTLDILAAVGYVIPTGTNYAYAYENDTNSKYVYLTPITVKIATYGVGEDSQQIVVSGAKFSLTCLSNTDLDSARTDGTDVSSIGTALKFTGDTVTTLDCVPSGNYSLIELTPPDEHLAVQEITFSIDSDGNITNLTNAILLDDNVIKIVHEKYEIGAFENAKKLWKISIPESVKKIGKKSFSGTLLKSVKIASDCEYHNTSFPENCGIEFYDDGTA